MRCEEEGAEVLAGRDRGLGWRRLERATPRDPGDGHGDGHGDAHGDEAGHLDRQAEDPWTDP